MANINPEIIEQKFKSLPQDLREVISNEENALTLEAIGKKYGLYIDKIGELVEETGLVMLGLTHPRDFIANLERRLGVPREKAAEIAQDVNQQIFAKVRESLKKLHKIEENEITEDAKLKNKDIKPTPPETLPTEPETRLAPETPTAEQPPVSEPPYTPPVASPSSPPPPQSVFEKKLETEIHRMPKETKEVSEEQLKEIQIKQAQKYGNKDPYREPIE